MDPDYRYEAASIDGFLSQIVRLIQGGYVYYFRGRVPDGKDPHQVVRKLMAVYGIGGKKWRRERRYRGANAAAHILLYGRIFVIMLTQGRHEAFYRDHAYRTVKDRRGRKRRERVPVPKITRKALHVFGYTIFHDSEQRKTHVRLDDGTRRRVEVHLLSVCCWDAYRDRSRMEREFQRLPFQPYAPVYRQLRVIGEKVNQARRRRGFKKLDLYACMRKFRRGGPALVRRQEALPAKASDDAGAGSRPEVDS